MSNNITDLNSTLSNQINSLDLATTTGDYVKTVSQTNGQLAATTGSFVTSFSDSTTTVAPVTPQAVVNYVDEALGTVPNYWSYNGTVLYNNVLPARMAIYESRILWTVDSTSIEYTSSSLTAAVPIYATAFYETSDLRKKNIISEHKFNLQSINDIECVDYTLKDDKTQQDRIGVIAQDLLPNFPELVSGSEKDGYNVEYSKLSLVAIQAIQQLIKENQELKRRIESLEHYIKK